MSTVMTQEMEREDIEMLLPWFVVGKLDAADQGRVEAFLATHPDMRMQLDLIEAERADVTLNNEAVGAPPADALIRLMGQIESQSLAGRSGFASVSGMVQSALEWLGNRSALVPVAATAAIALVVQAGVIGALVWHGSAADVRIKGFETASAPVAAAEQLGTFVMAGFAPGATAQQIDKSLQSLGITIADGPGPGGIYRLRLSQKALGDAERDMLVTALKSNAGVIKFVLPAGP